MAEYRALGKLFIRKLIEPGERFTSDLPPGRNWEPLDDEAKAAVAKFRAEKGSVTDLASRLDPKPRDMGAVQIPENWQELTGAKRRGLAMKLGAPGTVTKDDANSFITAELERRAHKAA